MTNPKNLYLFKHLTPNEIHPGIYHITTSSSPELKNKGIISIYVRDGQVHISLGKSRELVEHWLVLNTGDYPKNFSKGVCEELEWLRMFSKYPESMMEDLFYESKLELVCQWMKGSVVDVRV